MSLFSNARDWLQDQLQAAAGVTVSYLHHDTQTTVSLSPWVGRTVFRSDLNSGAMVQWGDRDYLVRRDELVDTAGAELLPGVGDQLTETIDGVALTFEVQDPNPAEPAVRWSDPARSVYRLHVKWVS